MDPRFNEDYLVSSPEYAQTMDEVILPYLHEKEKITILTGTNGIRLYTVTYAADQPRGTVVIVHGFTENAFKYSELIYSLLRSGFSVIAWDQRGHGRSGREEKIPHHSITHVDSFSSYVQDLRIICDKLLAGMPKPWMVFSHSMGGAVTSLFLEQHHDVFSAAVFCAPMIAPNIGGVPAWAASALCQSAKALGRSKKQPFFMKTYSGPEDFNTSAATDPVRFAWYDGIKASSSEFQNSVPSYGWTLESIRVTNRILAEGAPESIACPVILFTAENDASVLPKPQKDFIERVRGGKHVLVANARHEIYRSANDVLFPWWHQVLGFLSEHAAGGNNEKESGK